MQCWCQLESLTWVNSFTPASQRWGEEFLGLYTTECKCTTALPSIIEKGDRCPDAQTNLESLKIATSQNINNISHKTESSSWTYKRKHHIINFLMWCNVCLPWRAVVARICLVSCELSSPGPKDARQHSFQITCFNLWLHASGSQMLSFCPTTCNLMLTLVNYLNFVNKSITRPQHKKRRNLSVKFFECWPGPKRSTILTQ